MGRIIDTGAKLLRSLPPESAHRWTMTLARFSASLIAHAPPDDPRLAVEALGLRFPNPLGLAAGFDKDALAPDVMLRLGLGFVECGTVTPHPQAGNPRPRLFRLPEDGAVINRMGFNSRGAKIAASRLGARTRSGVLGLNIGANRDSADRIEDYRSAFAVLAPLADYVAVNVSSPNTPGLRELQLREELTHLLDVLVSERAKRNLRTPLLLKIAPDITLFELDEIADAVLQSGAEGMIVGNTTIARPSSLKSRHAKEGGGLSGAPLFVASTALLRETWARVGAKLVLVGAGGVSSGASAYAKIRAGATLVQLYTALSLAGPGLIARIKRELLALLERDGYSSVVDAIGRDAPGIAGAEQPA